MIDYTINASNRKSLCEKINALDPLPLWQCTIRLKKSKRSLEQNRWARGFATAFGKHIGYEADDAYALLMYKCNPVFIVDPVTGGEIRVAGHFSSLDTKQAADVQDVMQRFCAELGFYWDE